MHSVNSTTYSRTTAIHMLQIDILITVLHGSYAPIPSYAQSMSSASSACASPSSTLLVVLALCLRLSELRVCDVELTRRRFEDGPGGAADVRRDQPQQILAPTLR